MMCSSLVPYDVSSDSDEDTESELSDLSESSDADTLSWPDMDDEDFQLFLNGDLTSNFKELSNSCIQLATAIFFSYR